MLGIKKNNLILVLSSFIFRLIIRESLVKHVLAQIIMSYEIQKCHGRENN